MYKHWKCRERIAKTASIFFRSKSRRRYIRDKIRFSGFIQTTGVRDFPIQKYPHMINIAFCFDARGVNLAAVAMRSLVDSAVGICDYNIYCVVDSGVDAARRNMLKRNIGHTKSKITFLTANHDFDNAARGGWPVSIWYRMMLVKLLPRTPKIIYADIDTIFFRDLIELDQMDMGKNLIAGVPAHGNKYINSGFLVMNLRQMRTDGLYEKWVNAARIKNYRHPDQDLLNFTTRSRVIYLPLRYNFQTYMGRRIFRLYPMREIEDVRHHLVVMHYSNWMKPWSAPNQRPVFSEYWWRVADKTGLYADKHLLCEFIQNKNDYLF